MEPVVKPARRGPRGASEGFDSPPVFGLVVGVVRAVRGADRYPELGEAWLFSHVESVRASIPPNCTTAPPRPVYTGAVLPEHPIRRTTFGVRINHYPILGLGLRETVTRLSWCPVFRAVTIGNERMGLHVGLPPWGDLEREYK